MSIFGNPLKIGGSGGGGGLTLPAVIAAMTGTTTGTTYVTTGTGNGSTDWEIHSYISDYVTYSNGIFTFTAAGAGTYNIYIAGRGINNTSGNARYCHYQMFHNTTIISQLTSSTWGSTGGTLSGPVTVTVSAGDTIYAQTKCNTGTVNVMLSYILEKTS